MLEEKIQEYRNHDSLFADGEALIKMICNILIILKVTDTLMASFIAGIQGTFIAGAVLFVFFAYLVRKGHQFPIYIWLIGAVIGSVTVFNSLNYLGFSIQYNILIIFELFATVAQFVAIFMLLTKTNCKYYFMIINKIKIELKK